MKKLYIWTVSAALECPSFFPSKCTNLQLISNVSMQTKVKFKEPHKDNNSNKYK